MVMNGSWWQKMANLLNWNRISENGDATTTYHIESFKPLTLLEFFKEAEILGGIDKWVSIRVNDVVVIEKGNKDINIYQGYEKYSDVKFSSCYANGGWGQMNYSFRKEG